MSTTAKSVAGAVALVLIGALGYIGAQWGLGAFDDDYRINVVLGELGQGVVSGTDVKIRGVSVGSVGEIELTDDLRAVAELVLDPDIRIPERATYAATGKTLLGEKQIEIRFDGSTSEGPFLAYGDTVSDAERVVELQDVLGSLTELFEAIDPDDLATLVTDGFGAFDGEEAAIASSIDQGKRATDVFSRSLEDQEAGIRDLSLVAETLGDIGPEFNRMGGELNAGLSTITDNQVALRENLEDLQRFSRVLNATFVVDRGNLDRLIVEGDSITRMLFAYRPEMTELTSGVADYMSYFNQEGFTAPGVQGVAAGFIQILTAFDDEVCRNLPPELTDPLPVCGGEGGRPPVEEVPDLPLPELPVLPGSAGDEGVLLEVPIPTELLRTEVPQRNGIDSLLRASLPGTEVDGR
jgi:phospholipid/cholesterol/gamma-HCH transport system substrate-binding protein